MHQMANTTVNGYYQDSLIYVTWSSVFNFSMYYDWLNNLFWKNKSVQITHKLKLV